MEEETELTKAIFEGNIKVCEELIKNGAEVNYYDKDGFSPLMIGS